GCEQINRTNSFFYFSQKSISVFIRQNRREVSFDIKRMIYTWILEIFGFSFEYISKNRMFKSDFRNHFLLVLNRFENYISKLRSKVSQILSCCLFGRNYNDISSVFDKSFECYYK